MKNNLTIGVAACLLSSQVVVGQDITPPDSLRNNRTTFSPIMSVLNESRAEVEVSDDQLDELASLQLEAIWNALGDYQNNYVVGLKGTQGKTLVGRALTMRFLPARPDVRGALRTLAAEGDWDTRYYSRAAEEGKPGDVAVVELGGASGDQLFGDVGALGMQLAGLKGAIIDGGTRDLVELSEDEFADFPVFVRYFDVDTSKWLGAEWNTPVRIGNATVLPGDIVVASDSGALFFPPELLEHVLSAARSKISLEDHQRELLRSGKYRFRDIYPNLMPELQEEYNKQQDNR